MVLTLINCVAGVIIAAEALNKLERTAPLTPGLTARQRLAMWLKAVAWSALALGGAGAIVTPLLPLERPTLQDVCIAVGFAVLIIRTRVKEG